MSETWRDSAAKRRRLKGQNDAHQVSYKRFKRRIIRGGRGGPAASTPLATRWQCEPSFDLDPVCQRLELGSPPRHHEPTRTEQQGNLEALSYCRAPTSSHPPCSLSANRRNVQIQGWVWRTAAQLHEDDEQAGSNVRREHLPFAPLDQTTVSLQGTLVEKLAAPSLLNDYYSDLLDCSSSGVIALALGSSVYLWNSETSSLVGCLDATPPSGRHCVSSVGWSRDGRVLAVGTRRGETQLWDVEQKRNMRCLPSHLSVVRALCWKQNLLSSGSALGHIHHLDVRAPSALVGVAVQGEGLCSLQWSPAGDRLASGSTDGLLHVWDGGIAGPTWSHQPITTMKQPSGVKAMGWCPWQRTVIATGGGWRDGELRMWDTQTGSCVTSVNTQSQVCSLRWAEKRRCLVTGHGLPHHQVRMWEFPFLGLRQRLTGHSNRVLHVAINPENTQIFSAGADQRFHVWNF